MTFSPRTVTFPPTFSERFSQTSDQPPGKQSALTHLGPLSPSSTWFVGPCDGGRRLPWQLLISVARSRGWKKIGVVRTVVIRLRARDGRVARWDWHVVSGQLQLVRRLVDWRFIYCKHLVLGTTLYIIVINVLTIIVLRVNFRVPLKSRITNKTPNKHKQDLNSLTDKKI